MLGINEEAYFSPSLSAEGGEACLKRFEGGDTGGNFFKSSPQFMITTEVSDAQTGGS